MASIQRHGLCGAASSRGRRERAWKTGADRGGRQPSPKRSRRTWTVCWSKTTNLLHPKFTLRVKRSFFSAAEIRTLSFVFFFMLFSGAAFFVLFSGATFFMLFSGAIFVFSAGAAFFVLFSAFFVLFSSTAFFVVFAVAAFFVLFVGADHSRRSLTRAL